MFVARIALRILDSERDAFLRYATTGGLAAREAPGCLRYGFFEDVGEAGRFVLYEEWSTRAVFDAYQASPLFAEAGRRLGPLLAAPPDTAYYESDNLHDPASCAVPPAPAAPSP